MSADTKHTHGAATLQCDTPDGLNNCAGVTIDTSAKLMCMAHRLETEDAFVGFYPRGM
eukprot:COSAG02_NODE_65486_length_258_cov_0.591195_1_plen_57_part_10